MKKLIITLISALVLGACSTTSVKNDTVKNSNTLNDIKKNSYVLSEICTNPSATQTLKVNSTERSGKVMSANSYNAELKAITNNNFNIFSVLLGKANDLTYTVVENTLHPSTYFLFKRNFTIYTPNTWGQWESPDYLFKEGSNYTFFWLSNKEVDKTNELLKINFKNQESVKVRFKLIPMEDYSHTVESLSQQEIQTHVEDCN